MSRPRRPTRDEDWGIGDRRPPGFELAPVAPALPAARPELVEQAREAIAQSRAPATVRGYERDWERFKRWVRAEGLLPFLPAAPDVVVLYLTALAREGTPARGRRMGRRGRSPATLDRARAAIRYWHHQAGHVSPTSHPAVIELLKGLRRRHEERTFRERPLMPIHLARIVPWLREHRSPIRFLRDRAILLAGFAGALRRGELAGLRREDVRIRDDGIYFALSRQQGERIAETTPGTKHHAASENKGVSFERDAALAEVGICPIEALREWAEASGGAPEAPFIRACRKGEVADAAVSTRKISRLVKAGAAAIGLDPTNYAAHSLRAGMATYLIWIREWNIFRVRDYMRHDNVETLNGYVRDWDETGGSDGG